LKLNWRYLCCSQVFKVNLLFVRNFFQKAIHIRRMGNNEEVTSDKKETAAKHSNRFQIWVKSGFFLPIIKKDTSQNQFSFFI